MHIRSFVAATLAAVALLGGTSAAVADSGAYGKAKHSPGVLSGNVVQVPVNVPVNVCGNSIDVIGVLNPAGGNGCSSAGHHGHGHGHNR